MVCFVIFIIIMLIISLGLAQLRYTESGNFARFIDLKILYRYSPRVLMDGYDGIVIEKMNDIYRLKLYNRRLTYKNVKYDQFEIIGEN